MELADSCSRRAPGTRTATAMSNTHETVGAAYHWPITHVGSAVGVWEQKGRALWVPAAHAESERCLSFSL